MAGRHGERFVPISQAPLRARFGSVASVARRHVLPWAVALLAATAVIVPQVALLYELGAPRRPATTAVIDADFTTDDFISP